MHHRLYQKIEKLIKSDKNDFLKLTGCGGGGGGIIICMCGGI